MTWNYRIMKRKVGNIAVYGMHEVFYNRKNQPNMCTEPIDVFAESPDELRKMLCRMLRDAREAVPVLDFDNPPWEKKRKGKKA